MNQPLPSKDTIWIGTVDEVAERSAEGRPIAADIESLDVAIESAIFALKGPTKTHRFILGVDTGPRPGLAWFTDGVLIDTKQTESVDACIELIQSLIDHHEFEHLLIRMGKGSPSHRKRLVNAMLLQGFVVELVDERKTSRGLNRNQHAVSATRKCGNPDSRNRGLNRNQHAVSAIRIATLPGERVFELDASEPKIGELRELQRRSRIKSEGRITISSELARKVALGELTLAEAIELI